MDFYEKLFVPRVAQGRGLSEQQVHEAGRGRVWTGRQAQRHGLVDELGDLSAAIELARRKAGIPSTQKVRTVTYARRAGLRHLLFDLPWSDAASAGVLGPILDLVELTAGEDALFLMPPYLQIK